VLERRRVEHQIRQRCSEDGAQAVEVANVGEDDLITLEQSLAGQAQLRCLQTGFVTVEHVELLGAEPGDLATQL
jgi:hypothetical protein